MPNWCENTLRITPKTDAARAMLPALIEGFRPQTDRHAFSVINPTPEELMSHASPQRDADQAARFEAAYGARDWYDWCVKNWGTKWPSDNHHVVKGDTLIAYFATAWSPPIGIYQSLLNLGFDVFATYAECGIGYAGIWDNGIDQEMELADGEGEYPFEDEAAVLEATFPNIPDELRPPGLGG